MKRIITCLILLVCLQIYGQDYNETLNAIRVSEAKTALRQMMSSRNLNTGNYDVKYHRLELNVDPSQALISGDITTYFEAKEAMTEITFDLADNMAVSQVLQRGNNLDFTQNSNDELVIS